MEGHIRFSVDYEIGKPYLPYKNNNDLILREDKTTITFPDGYAVPTKTDVHVLSLDDTSYPVIQDSINGVLCNVNTDMPYIRNKCRYCRDRLPHSIALHDSMFQEPLK